MPDKALFTKADWNCSKCGVNNFRRRFICFKCSAHRGDSEQADQEGADEISSSPTQTLLFRGLDVLTTEDRVLAVLGNLTALPIKNIRVAKDSLTNISKGYCFVELHSTSEATQLHDRLLSMCGQFYVDGRQVTVSYAKRLLTSMNRAARANAANVALAAAQWTNQSEIPSDSNYYNYYDQNQANEATTTQSFDTQNDTTSTTTVTQASSTAGTQVSHSSLGTVIVNGVTYSKYPVPDISTYQYDETSGYYYDSTTGLYYDANSQYYYSADVQGYLYWSGEHQTYLPAPTDTQDSAAQSGTNVPTAVTPAELADDEKGKCKEKEKQEKVKYAKKVAKEMERWAKELNQKKANAKSGVVSNPPVQAPMPEMPVPMGFRSSATADAGFAMLEKRSFDRQGLFDLANIDSQGPALVAAYGGGSDSESEHDGVEDGSSASGGMAKFDENKLVDWNQMACLLCKRKFPNKDTLMKHQQLSDLHKQNLEVMRRKHMSTQELEKEREGSGYRDRAKERRQKFGQPEAPHPNRLKEKYMKNLQMQKDFKNYEEPTKEGIGSDNIGNKMLKAMGWQEGQGLGRSNQGMAGIIEVERRVATAGLGLKGSSYGANAGTSYKEAVKKLTLQRFQDLQ